MSHISTYGNGTKITNKELFLRVCEAKGYDVRMGKHTVRQFGSNAIECVGSVLITGWRYRVAITEDGELKYDHFGSNAGTMQLLGETVQQYNEAGLHAEIPWELVQNEYTEELANGDRKLILEFA